MAVSMAQPTDVVKVRFQAQMNLQGVARRYNGTMQAYRQIFLQEGLRGLWKGQWSNLYRNCMFYCEIRKRIHSDVFLIVHCVSVLMMTDVIDERFSIVVTELLQSSFPFFSL